MCGALQGVTSFDVITESRAAVIQLPPRSPNLNAYAERFMPSYRVTVSRRPPSISMHPRILPRVPARFSCNLRRELAKNEGIVLMHQLNARAGWCCPGPHAEAVDCERVLRCRCKSRSLLPDIMLRLRCANGLFLRGGTVLAHRPVVVSFGNLAWLGHLLQ